MERLEDIHIRILTSNWYASVEINILKRMKIQAQQTKESWKEQLF